MQLQNLFLNKQANKSKQWGKFKIRMQVVFLYRNCVPNEFIMNRHYYQKGSWNFVRKLQKKAATTEGKWFYSTSTMLQHTQHFQSSSFYPRNTSQYLTTPPFYNVTVSLLKSSFALEATCFKSVPKVKKKTPELLRRLMKEDRLHCFDLQCKADEGDFTEH